MPNANTTHYAIRIPGAAQGASSTSEFQFKNIDNVIAEFSVGQGVLTNNPFRIRLGGRVTGGTTTNFTAKLYVGTALGAAVASLGAIAFNSVSGSFELIADLYVDPTSNKLQGLFSGNANATVVAATNVNVSSVDPTTVLVFGASGQFSASNANNAAVLDYFELDQM